MKKGIIIKRNNTTTSLLLNDVVVADVVSIDKSGLVANNNSLFLDGELLLEATIDKSGLVIKDGKLYCNGVEINNTPSPIERYWNPPLQQSSTYKPWSYLELIDLYDELMASSDGYITKKKYSETATYGDATYELFSYILEPPNYKQTFVFSVGVHGNEMDSKQQMLRFFDIMVNKYNQEGYEPFRKLREDVRFVIIPCVSPWGHDHESMNVPYPYGAAEISSANHGCNLNRNYDFNQQYALESTGVGGDYPWQYPETRHVKSIVENVGVENINYYFDWHDGGNVDQHIWINYCCDGENGQMVRDLVAYYIEKWDIENPVIDNCNDNGTTGTASSWAQQTLGVQASVVEWIGGFLGYDFSAEVMTKSMDLRFNMILEAYKSNFITINIPTQQEYFDWGYGKAFTRKSIRLEGTSQETKVSDNEIYNRWDSLKEMYPALITKSAKLGENATATCEVYTYTVGNGSKKILLIGGIMRFGGQHKIDEYTIWQLMEYVCNPISRNKSEYLTALYNDYTFVILPCIDNVAANNLIDRESGLNNMALSYKKWQIVDGVCQPATKMYRDTSILLTLLRDNLDAVGIVSGGEIMTGYAVNTDDYSTEFDVQLVTPKNMATSSNVNNYISYLSDKGEDVITEPTIGTTFGDYMWDNYNIPTYFIQSQTSKVFEDRRGYLKTPNSDKYRYSNHESTRLVCIIANIILCF